ncbi:MAG: hypothetical protein HN725_16695 [Alphaproteobacteria bacterium]|jgi:predicted transcriptional regulator|nr:hypothetical protein [Alphaproteobacteria bacterium]MBT4084974.1 hypothetical protein [Alphaproteobacteria bacterium]MBT4545522.1 hypothetical protein [Alphaproteobacteria bacterium]MBT6386423.1 hypothetical protein [Alphaproteobacteria bacterium]MBT7746931.1 hypothetical protein [Alphaproteobacteria bacterium]
MAEVKIHVDRLEDMASRFTAAWKKAEAGEAVDERHLSFESWSALTQALSVKRLELLKWLNAHEEPSIRSLSKSLHRDYRRVHEDVQILRTAGLIAGDSLHVECDRIHTEIAL